MLMTAHGVGHIQLYGIFLVGLALAWVVFVSKYYLFAAVIFIDLEK